MIAILIGYESVTRLFAPVAIRFGEAIPIAFLGFGVNVASAWLLSGGDHDHHGHGHDHDDEEDLGEVETVRVGKAAYQLAIFERGAPPRFRLSGGDDTAAHPTVETIRPAGKRETFAMVARGSYLESTEEIPKPHAFEVVVRVGDASGRAKFKENEHGHYPRDNNMRAAIVHVLADAAVSVLVITRLFLARSFGWL